MSNADTTPEEGSLLPEVQHARPLKSKADRRKEQQEAIREAARDQFDGMVNKAIATIEELCEMGDSESVRLDAAKTILRMSEIDPGTTRNVNVAVDDRRAIRAELEATLEALARNNPTVVEALTQGAATHDDVVDADLVE